MGIEEDERDFKEELGDNPLCTADCASVNSNNASVSEWINWLGNALQDCGSRTEMEGEKSKTKETLWERGIKRRSEGIEEGEGVDGGGGRTADGVNTDGGDAVASQAAWSWARWVEEEYEESSLRM